MFRVWKNAVAAVLRDARNSNYDPARFPASA